jgi:hypothetical protein
LIADVLSGDGSKCEERYWPSRQAIIQNTLFIFPERRGMATDTTTLPVKFHISLNVADLERSVKFYQLLFDCEPAK